MIVMAVVAAGLVLVPDAEPATAGGPGPVSLVSHISESPTATGNLMSPAGTVSADGAFVLFGSYATNMVAGQNDANARPDVFLFERATGAVTLVSHIPGSATTTGNQPSIGASISADGSFVMFISQATNLVAGQSDANGANDVFLFERATGMVTLVSHTPGSTTTAGNAASDSPSISADGSFVAFRSSATDLVSGQSGSGGVFLFERATWAVSLVSHTPDSTTTSAGGDSPSISADGSSVGFESGATNLVAGQTDPNGGLSDVFVFEWATGLVSLVSHTPDSATTTGNGGSGAPSVSADGTVLAFESKATNLVAGQSDANPENAETDVFLFDRATGSLTLVSHTPDSATTTGNGPSIASSVSRRDGVSADGNFVVFESRATDLVAGQSDPNGGADDVFLFERATGAVTLVSHTPDSTTTTANSSSFEPSVSADGAFVSFASNATNVVAGQIDPNGSGEDVFVFERSTGEVALVSHAPGSATTTSGPVSFMPTLADDGAVAFGSHSTDLVVGQTEGNDGFDMFLYEPAGGPAPPTSFSNPTPIQVPRPNPPAGCPSFPPPNNSCPPTSATPYPSAISVAGQVGAVSDVNVTLHDLTYTIWDASDLDVMLVAPDGSRVMLMSDACGESIDSTELPITTPIDLTFDDAAASGLPEDTACTSGTFRPTDDDNDPNFDFTGNDVFCGPPTTPGSCPPAGAPATANTTLLSTFNGIDPNGTWSLYVVDDTPGDPHPTELSGQFAGGWSLEITTAQAPTTSAPPADFDGDDDTDVSVFRPSNGVWFVQGGPTVPWGTTGDIPVPGDYDGDDDTDIAVFRPSNGVWFVQGGPTVAWGTTGDIPVPGDYDGDGTTEIAVFRPSTGTWFVQGGPTVAWGTTGDIPVPGDYDGNGTTDIAVFRPSNGVWFVQGGPTVAWGTNGDIPAPGDYDGNGTTDIAVFRPSNGVWFVQGGPTVAFGTSGDIPLPLPAAIQRFFFPPA